jgi:hypothetical protein
MRTLQVSLIVRLLTSQKSLVTVLLLFLLFILYLLLVFRLPVHKQYLLA